MGESMRVALCQFGMPMFEFRKELGRTISFYGIKGKRIDALDYVVGRLEENDFPKETLVVLPECVPGTSGIDNIGKLKEFAESRELYVQAGIYQKVTNKPKAYNSSVLLDTKGAVSGTYHKIYPTKEELENFIEPGENPELFEMKQNDKKYRIGPIICNDIASNAPGDETPMRKRDGSNTPILEDIYNKADVLTIQAASIIGLSVEGRPFFEHWTELLKRMVEKYGKPIVYVNCVDRDGRSKALIPENGKAKIIKELSGNKEEILLIEI
jgi:predicted amidohydrolase